MKQPQKLIAACLQHACGEDPKLNLESSIAKIESAATQKAQLIVLPELHLTPYFCQQQSSHWFAAAETIPGPTTDRLSALAKKLKVVIVASIFEKRQPGVFHNTAVVLEKDGSIAGIYRKMHIPQDPGFEEKFYFAPGDLGFNPITTSLGKLGVLICWDQWFPEAARIMALKGANCLIYPTAIGWTPSDPIDSRSQQLDAWQVIQRSHSVANHLPVLSCNRIGLETTADESSHIQFWGSSFMTDHQGQMLAQANRDEEEILIAELDFAATEHAHLIWPFFRDRRVEAYADLLHLSLNPGSGEET